jgi:hypothetical protein
MLNYTKNRLPERSTWIGLALIVLVILAGLFVPAERLDAIGDAWESLSKLLGLMGLAAVVLPERKSGGDDGEG